MDIGLDKFRTTAGVVLGGEPFPLARGWTLTVPTHASWGPDGKRYVDTPVTPDVEVKWTRQHFCDQRHPDISKALDLLDAARSDPEEVPAHSFVLSRSSK